MKYLSALFLTASLLPSMLSAAPKRSADTAFDETPSHYVRMIITLTEKTEKEAQKNLDSKEYHYHQYPNGSFKSDDSQAPRTRSHTKRKTDYSLETDLNLTPLRKITMQYAVNRFVQNTKTTIQPNTKIEFNLSQAQGENGYDIAITGDTNDQSALVLNIKAKIFRCFWLQ
jgi:hypothetical protein